MTIFGLNLYLLFYQQGLRPKVRTSNFGLGSFDHLSKGLKVTGFMVDNRIGINSLTHLDFEKNTISRR